MRQLFRLIIGIIMASNSILSYSINQKEGMDLLSSQLPKKYRQYAKDRTVASLNAYFSGIDEYVCKSLDSGLSFESIQMELRKLSEIDPEMPQASYRLLRLITNSHVIYFGEYRISSWAGSSIRIYQDIEGQHQVTFEFTPKHYEALGIEEYISIENVIWTGQEILVVGRCIGETSGFAPKGSVFVWAYDEKKKKAVELIKLLHKNGISIRPLASETSYELEVKYLGSQDDEVDLSVTYLEVYSFREGQYKLRRRQCIRDCTPVQNNF